MNKLFAVVLAAVLTGSLVFASFDADLITADAVEPDAPSETVEPTLIIPEEPTVASDQENNSVIADEGGAENPLPSVTEGMAGESTPEEPVVSEELPYWESDATYSELLQQYDDAAARGGLVGAVITISDDAEAGLAGEIFVEGREVVSNGLNAPDYNDLSGIHLTPREGYPSAGMTSDRSVLTLVESTDESDIYEALFFFASEEWPEAPYTAFSTYVVLEAEQTARVDVAENVGETTASESVSETEKRSYESIAAEFHEHYFSDNFGPVVLNAFFTVTSVAEDGTVTGTVTSDGYTILGTSGVAKVLTEEAPAVGQTSDGAYLVTNGSSYDATFLFGSIEIGATEGCAVGDFQVSLVRSKPIPPGGLVPEALAPGLQPEPSFAALSDSLNTLDWDIYVGHQSQAIIKSAGNWNGSVGNAWFSMTIDWMGELLSFRIKCHDAGIPGPELTRGYIGRIAVVEVMSVDRMGGEIEISVYAEGPDPVNYQKLYVRGIYHPWEFQGELHIIKKSTNPEITNGNDCYSLIGAQYGLYYSWADAYYDWNRVFTYTIHVADAAGVGYALPATHLPNRTYYLKEVKAPKGYQLDSTIQEVTHGSTVTYHQVRDVPLGDPNLMLVQKIDTTTREAYGKDDPNGYLLAGAEFTVRYWDGYYDTIEEAELSGEPTRTWILKTETTGRTYMVDRLLVEGSDPFFLYSGYAIIPLGTVAIQETAPPPGYLLPDPNEVYVQQIKETGDPLAPVTRLNEVIVEEEPHEVEVIKKDKDSQAPVADTEFTLYKEGTAGAEDWTEVTTLITDENGKCTFSPVAVGSYKLDETRANPQYAELEESEDGAHYFEILPTSTDEIQVFKNEVIQVSIEVYKKTIPLTNTALDGRPDQYSNIVGQEEYLYHFGAKSNSNVRVDEFVITDSLEFVTSKGYRMTTLWTGTAPADMDYDGLMHVLYKTNMTDSSEPVTFNYNPMQANPPNANNPLNHMSVSIQPGWRVWQECVSTTDAVRLEVADLGLKQGEYITGLRIVYGGVVKGFYTGANYDASVRNFSYSVIATGALLPYNEMGDETVMQGSIQADLFRNWGGNAPVLTDIDLDKVETRVINTFTYDDENLGIKPGGFSGSFLGFPMTGDMLWQLVLGAALIATLGAILIVGAVRHRKLHSTEGK